MNDEVRANVTKRLRRAAGQVEGVVRMVDDDRYCIDIVLQITAARAALAKASKVLLESHMQTCVRDAFSRRAPGDREEKIAELLRVFDKSCNC